MSADTATAPTEAEPSPRPDAPRPPVRTIALGTAGSVLMLVSSFGAAALPARLFPTGPLATMHYGHGRALSSIVIYIGFVMLVWAWVRLGRYVLDGKIGSRPILVATALWAGPLLLAPALFTKDVYSYFAQGAIAIQGWDPYTVGPDALGPTEIMRSVHPFWAATPAPYGPLFILLSKGVAWIAGSNVMVGVILTRLTLLPGLALLLWALPGLVRHLGGRLPVALWLVVAGPMTVVHLIGGPHNDLLMIGFLAAGTLLVLDGRHTAGVALVTLGVAVKATAVIALPFLVWVWAGHLESSRARNLVRAIGCAVATFVVVFAACTLLAGVDLGWIGMLNQSSRIVNWLSLPTAAGELVHWLVARFADISKDYFVTVTRLLGMLALAMLLAREWWLARAGGTDAVRRAAVALFAVAILSPTTLPWYLTWGLALAACFPWQRRHLAIAAGIAAFLVVTYTPDGETNLYEYPFMAVAIAMSALAGISLMRPDPLSVGRRR